MKNTWKPQYNIFIIYQSFENRKRKAFENFLWKRRFYEFQNLKTNFFILFTESCIQYIRFGIENMRINCFNQSFTDSPLELVVLSFDGQQWIKIKKKFFFWIDVWTYLRKCQASWEQFRNLHRRDIRRCVQLEFKKYRFILAEFLWA